MKKDKISAIAILIFILRVISLLYVICIVFPSFIVMQFANCVFAILNNFTFLKLTESRLELPEEVQKHLDEKKFVIPIQYKLPIFIIFQITIPISNFIASVIMTAIRGIRF